MHLCVCPGLTSRWPHLRGAGPRAGCAGRAPAPRCARLPNTPVTVPRRLLGLERPFSSQLGCIWLERRRESLQKCLGYCWVGCGWGLWGPARGPGSLNVGQSPERTRRALLGCSQHACPGTAAWTSPFYAPDPPRRCGDRDGERGWAGSPRGAGPRHRRRLVRPVWPWDCAR